MTHTFRAATAADAPAVAAIYRHYVETSTATFETVPPGDEAMAARIDAVLSKGLPYLIATDEDDTVVGFAYASPFQEREAYRHSVESTIYLAPDIVRVGLGTRLYRALLDTLASLEEGSSPHAPVHRVYARVSVPRPGSQALHERCGFTSAGVWHEVGRKFDRWLDVVLYELRLPSA